MPLAEAWESGAHAWNDRRREKYANGVGPYSQIVRSVKRAWLIPVCSELNRAKGAKRPDEWMPPNEHYHIHYVADWIATKHYWKMSVTKEEKAFLLKVLATA